MLSSSPHPRTPEALCARAGGSSRDMGLVPAQGSHRGRAGVLSGGGRDAPPLVGDGL